MEKTKFYSHRGECWLLVDHNKIPQGMIILVPEKKGTAGLVVMAGRDSPKGTGKVLLKNIIKVAKDRRINKLTLVTAYHNYKMLVSALQVGFKVSTNDPYGYTLVWKMG